ncbi:MAG: cell division protein FtsZ [Bacteroidaceae bacterium]|nr:cell division protein FtsZ [Bacteroidaceae bacterium]
MEDQIFIEIPVVEKKSFIKVIGVGGGGGNAVSRMSQENMYDVSFLVCNSDAQALQASPIANKLQIGPGLGCGGNPALGKHYAENALAEIYDAVEPEILMAFVTAGMGGGTGTGAAPVVAREMKARNILTVGVVTLPFKFEGQKNIDKALDGMERMANEVDSLLVINNERMRSVYAVKSVVDAFKLADNVLTLAVKSIIDIIKMHGTWNLDFNDVQMVLREGGVSIISMGYARGNRRISKAIKNALDSPLLNNNNIFGARKMVMCITFSETHDCLMMEELDEVNQFMEKFHHVDLESKYGMATDESLGDEVKVTILASGFNLYNEPSEQKQEDLIAQIQRGARIERFYGDQAKPIKTQKAFYIYDPTDFDNEDIMDRVDNTVSVHRTHDQLDMIKALKK